VFFCAPDFAGVETIEGELTGSDAPQYRPSMSRGRLTVAASTGNGVDVETGTALILAEDRARARRWRISVIQQSTAMCAMKCVSRGRRAVGVGHGGGAVVGVMIAVG